MMPEHARRVNMMPPDVLDYLLWYFDARRDSASRRSRAWLPSVSIAEVGAGQADVVLALLRADSFRFDRWAECLMGRRITACPPALRVPPHTQLEYPDASAADMRRITHVYRNDCLPTTGRFYRWRMFRPGMTIQQFLVRGGQRRDVRVALSRGAIRVENWGAFEPARRAA